MAYLGITFFSGMYILSGPIGLGVDSVEDYYYQLDKSDDKVFAEGFCSLIGFSIILTCILVEISFFYVWVIGLIYIFKEEITRFYLKLKRVNELDLADTRI